MRVQVAHPSEHAAIADLPFREPLDEWSMSNVHPVLGLHRHVVKLVEFPEASYVVKELPDHLALREYRLLRQIADDGLPTAEGDVDGERRLVALGQRETPDQPEALLVVVHARPGPGRHQARRRRQDPRCRVRLARAARP